MMMPDQTANITEVVPSEGIMWTLPEIAARDGVTRQAVSLQALRLHERSGLSVERDGRGRIRRINVAQYDRLRGQHADLARSQAPVRDGPGLEPDGRTSTDPSYTREQARNMAYTAELKRLEIDERAGRLVRKDLMVEALNVCVATVKRHIEGIQIWAEDLTYAAVRDGEAGTRRLLRKKSNELREAIANSFSAAAQHAPMTDPLPDPEDEATGQFWTATGGGDNPEK